MWPSPPFGDPCLASGAEQAQLRQEIGATCEPQIVEPHLDFRRPDVGKAFLVEGQTLVDEIQPAAECFGKRVCVLQEFAPGHQHGRRQSHERLLQDASARVPRHVGEQALVGMYRTHVVREQDTAVVKDVFGACTIDDSGRDKAAAVLSRNSAQLFEPSWGDIRQWNRSPTAHREAETAKAHRG